MNMTLLQAIDHVKSILLEGEPEGTRVDIVMWDAFHDSVGVRVAEIDWVLGNAGACVFAGAPESAALVFAVERYILDLMHFPSAVPDSEYRLRRALK